MAQTEEKQKKNKEKIKKKRDYEMNCPEYALSV